MQRYRVQRVTGSSMDELEGNLRILLNGLSDEEECVSVSMGIREALVVIGKAAPPRTAPVAAPQAAVPQYPPSLQAAAAYSPPVAPVRPYEQTFPQAAEEPMIVDVSAFEPPETQDRQQPPRADARPQPMGGAMASPDGRPATVQFIPRRPAQQPARPQPEPAQAPQPQPQVPAPPAPQRPGSHPELLFRSCTYCRNQLIVPHVPISVMCPHCKSTLTITE